MSEVALVVAGGAGERMRRSGARVPKPLVEVAGRTLLEHNLVALVRAGVDEVHVAVSAQDPRVGAFLDDRGAAIADEGGIRLHRIVEDPPLGSLGAAAMVDAAGDLLVVNADNLTALDLRRVTGSHRSSGAAMTLAVHDEPFPMPFGEITLDGDRVVAYREKPTYRIRICSAVTVLGSEARAAIEPGENVGLPALANRLLERGSHVHSFVHDAPWIDVNDLPSAARAEALYAEHRDLFTGVGA